MFDRRGSTIIPYRSAVSLRQNLVNEFPRATVIIGRSFGPFSRSTSLHQQQHTVALSSFRRQKSIVDGRDINNDNNNIPDISKSHAKAGDDNDNVNKFQCVTSAATTQPTAIDINHDDELEDVTKEPGTMTKTVSVAEINARNKALIGTDNSIPINRPAAATKANPPAPPPPLVGHSQYKFLRRQYSMDQKQLAFHVGPVGGCGAAGAAISSRWRRNRFDSVDVINRRAIVETSKLAEEEEEEIIAQLKGAAPDGTTQDNYKDNKW